MKIYLVTMKSLPNDQIATRLACIKKEKENPEYEREYSWISKDKDEAAFSAFSEAVKARASLLNSLGITIPARESSKEPDGYHEFSHLENPTFACTGSQLLEILAVDDSVTVKSSAPVSGDSFEGVLARFQEIVSKMESLDIPTQAATAEHVYNERCDVHVPGNMLISYNETLLLEDSCTDNLQSYLNSGWRIVAVCPQAQRRPDYIMGRYNPDLDIGGSARRG